MYIYIYLYIYILYTYIYIYMCVCLYMYMCVYINSFILIRAANITHVWHNIKKGKSLDPLRKQWRRYVRPCQTLAAQTNPAQTSQVSPGSPTQPSAAQLAVKPPQKIQNLTNHEKQKDTCRNKYYYLFWRICFVATEIRQNINHIYDQLGVQVLLLVWSGSSNLSRFRSGPPRAGLGWLGCMG